MTLILEAKAPPRLILNQWFSPQTRPCQICNAFATFGKTIDISGGFHHSVGLVRTVPGRSSIPQEFLKSRH